MIDYGWSLLTVPHLCLRGCGARASPQDCRMTLTGVSTSLRHLFASERGVAEFSSRTLPAPRALMHNIRSPAPRTTLAFGPALRIFQARKQLRPDLRLWNKTPSAQTRGTCVKPVASEDCAGIRALGRRFGPGCKNIHLDSSTVWRDSSCGHFVALSRAD